jgi:tungstate transport system permease protein
MTTLGDSFLTAWQLVAAADARLAGIVWLSLRVSLAATLIACIVGMPVGALLAVGRFPGGGAGRAVQRPDGPAAGGGRPAGLPAAVARRPARVRFGLLFSPTAMVIAQAILVTPIVAALTRQVVADAWTEYREQLRSLGASRTRRRHPALGRPLFAIHGGAGRLRPRHRRGRRGDDRRRQHRRRDARDDHHHRPGNQQG